MQEMEVKDMSLEEKQFFIVRAFKKYEVEKLQGNTNLDFTEWFQKEFVVTETKFVL